MDTLNIVAHLHLAEQVRVCRKEVMFTMGNSRSERIAWDCGTVPLTVPRYFITFRESGHQLHIVNKQCYSDSQNATLLGEESQ